MSRYLDRMIAGARGQVSNVRPILRPVFLDAAPSRAGLVEESREVAAPAPASHAASEAHSASRNQPREFRNTAQPPAPQPQAAEENHQVPAERESYRPLLLETQRVEQVVELLTTRRSEPRRQNFSEEREQASAVPPIFEKEPASRPQDTAQPPQREHVFHVDTRTAAQPAQRIPTLPKPSAVAQDHIEIHVGRIEILATPPPAAPVAAPRRARTAVNLAEYLKRGERA